MFCIAEKNIHCFPPPGPHGNKCMRLWRTSEDILVLMKNNKIHIEIGLEAQASIFCPHSKDSGLQ